MLSVSQSANRCGSCVPAHAVCALQGQGLGLVGRGRAGRAAEGGAVGGRGVTGRVRVLEVEGRRERESDREGRDRQKERDRRGGEVEEKDGGMRDRESERWKERGC